MTWTFHLMKTMWLDNTHLLMSGTIVFIITVTSRTMSISCIKSNNCFRFQHQSNGKIFIFLRSFIRHYDYQRNISKKAMLSYMTVFKPLEMAYLLITRLQMHNLNLNQVGMTLSLAILLKSRIWYEILLQVEVIECQY